MKQVLTETCFEKQVSVTRFSVFYCNNSVILGQKICDGFAPFDDDDVGGGFEVFAEVVGHDAWVGEAVEVVVDEAAVRMRQSVGFGNGVAGAGDGFLEV